MERKPMPCNRPQKRNLSKADSNQPPLEVRKAIEVRTARLTFASARRQHGDIRLSASRRFNQCQDIPLGWPVFIDIDEQLVSSVKLDIDPPVVLAAGDVNGWPFVDKSCSRFSRAGLVLSEAPDTVGEEPQRKGWDRTRLTDPIRSSGHRSHGRIIEVIQAVQLPPSVFEPRVRRLPGWHGSPRAYAGQDNAACPFNSYYHAAIAVVFCDLVSNRPTVGHCLAVSGMERSDVIAVHSPKKMDVKEISTHLATPAAARLSTS
nr:hypothetical protein [Ensifer sp. ZNC0028]